MLAIISVAAAALLPAAPAPAAAANGDASAQVLKSESDVNENGFSYSYETSNGIKGEAKGDLKQIGEGKAVVQQGSFSWTAPDGQTYTVNWTADENGNAIKISIVIESI